MKTADKIVLALKNSPLPLAVHELANAVYGASECAISARLRELARDGVVVGAVRAGENYKEWRLSQGLEFKVESTGQVVFL